MRAPALIVVLGLSFSASAARPDDPFSDELFKFDPGDVVEVFDTERFRVHFARAGTHAVPATDADASGVPDHVEEVAAIYDDVLAFYTGALGFRAPVSDVDVDPVGDGRFDVYLVDFGFSADGAFRAEGCDADGVCEGFMVQENDFAGYGYPSRNYANRLLASHELFHAVQAAYSSGQSGVFGEGTAVWASDQFDPSLDDLELYASEYLEQTDRPLNSGSGAVDSFTYGSGIFWAWLAESFGDDVIRALWEACAENPGADWFELIDGVLVEAGAAGFSDVFAEFAAATLFTGDRADPSRGLDDGAAFPEMTLEGEALPFFDDSFLLFISSFESVSVNPGDRAELRAVLVGEGVDVDGLRLVVAPLVGDTVGDVVVAEGKDVSLDVSAADFVIVQVINTRQTGDGARPALCLGSPDEVDACVAALAPPAEEPAAPAPDEPEGCAAARSGSGALPGLGVLLVLMRRRRIPHRRQT